MLQAGIFLVEDATQDERFADNPLVTDDPGIRFYAGHPLLAANGDVVGTLCIIGRQPREFSEQDEQCLRDLAQMRNRSVSITSRAASIECTTA